MTRVLECVLISPHPPPPPIMTLSIVKKYSCCLQSLIEVSGGAVLALQTFVELMQGNPSHSHSNDLVNFHLCASWLPSWYPGFSLFWSLRHSVRIISTILAKHLKSFMFYHHGYKVCDLTHQVFRCASGNELSFEKFSFFFPFFIDSKFFIFT